MKKIILIISLAFLILSGSLKIFGQNNPMGNTWVVFIENSNYERLSKLNGPTKDVNLLKRALANYQVNNFVHLSDMTKTQMEKYFNIDLRDQLKRNNVKSLLIWYAGNGKYLNQVGYWMPVDCKIDDEFTWFNLNGLKASLQSYSNVIHILVVSDASEAGVGFFQAIRTSQQELSCDNLDLASCKSFQIFSSTGFESAADNSLFAQTFSNTLINNLNACIPIESVVKNVSAAVAGNSQQRPKFGKIAGLMDENGTFFFIQK